MTILEYLVQWAQSEDILRQQDENSITFSVAGEHGDWFSKAFELDQNLLYLMSCYPFRVSEAHRADVTRALDEINQQLKIGWFYLNAESGQIYFRLSNFIFTTVEEEMKNQVLELLMFTMQVTDSYYPQIMSLVSSGEAAE